MEWGKEGLKVCAVENINLSSLAAACKVKEKSLCQDRKLAGDLSGLACILKWESVIWLERAVWEVLEGFFG